jgi:hypothetical protein
VIYDMSNDLTFQFKKHLKEEDDVERKKKGWEVFRWCFQW